LKKFGILVSSGLLIASAFLITATNAQDATMEAPMMEAVTCDSTVAVLLLVAEHDYDYLSGMMMDEEAMAMMPHINLGQYQPLVDEIMAMMTAMMEEEPMMDMTEEEMVAHDEMLKNMMSMSTKDMISTYMTSMNMDMSGDMMELTPGNVDGEPAECAAVRADVEKFLVAHIITEMSMMPMEGQ